MHRAYLWIFICITPYVSVCTITTALLMLGTDKISDKMQMCCLNTQFNVFGIFRVAVQGAEEQLGPFDYHDTAPSFAAQPRQDFGFFLNHGGEFGTCQRNETSPSKENRVDIYSQGEGKVMGQQKLNGKSNLDPTEDDEQVFVQQLLTDTTMFGKG